MNKKIKLQDLSSTLQLMQVVGNAQNSIVQMSQMMTKDFEEKKISKEIVEKHNSNLEKKFNRNAKTLSELEQHLEGLVKTRLGSHITTEASLDRMRQEYENDYVEYLEMAKKQKEKMELVKDKL